MLFILGMEGEQESHDMTFSFVCMDGTWLMGFKRWPTIVNYQPSYTDRIKTT
jgi:hypothetical protein